MKNPYKWTVEIEVHPVWVADGFDLTDDRANDILAHALPYAQSHEFKAKVLAAPDPKQIECEQGSPVEGYKPVLKSE